MLFPPPPPLLLCSIRGQGNNFQIFISKILLNIVAPSCIMSCMNCPYSNEYPDWCEWNFCISMGFLLEERLARLGQLFVWTQLEPFYWWQTITVFYRVDKWQYLVCCFYWPIVEHFSLSTDLRFLLFFSFGDYDILEIIKHGAKIL